MRGGLLRPDDGHGQGGVGASASRSSAGRTLGLVGESGCGKTHDRPADPAAARARRRVRCSFRGEELCDAEARRELRALRGKIQIVFQDPYASLNPRMTVRSIIGEPMRIHRRRARARARRGSRS